MSEHDSLIATFQSVVNEPSTEAAAKALQSHNWNLEAAVAAYLDPLAAPATNARKRRRPAAPSGGNGNDDDDDEVRAPLPTRTERLYEPHPLHGAVRYATRGGDPFRNYRLEWSEKSRETAFDSDDVLARLFAPPHDVCFTGPFDEACAHASRENRWLLVNVQDPANFDSQCLNRDTWRDPRVKQLLRTRFVFWQQNRNTGSSQTYARFYHVAQFPHIAIVDPITRQEMKTWSTLIKGNEMFEQLNEFLTDHAPNPKSLGASSALAAPSSSSSSISPADSMTEEEMLAAAIKRSLSEQPPAKRQRVEPIALSSDDDDDNDEEDLGWSINSSPPSSSTTTAAAAAAAANASPASPPTPSTPPSPSSPLPPEPAASDSTTRIQFRMPSGKRLVRRFPSTAPVRHLYKFVASHVATPVELFTMRPRKAVPRSADTSISSAGLLRAALVVEPASP